MHSMATTIIYLKSFLRKCIFNPITFKIEAKKYHHALGFIYAVNGQTMIFL